nr:unnamed protein product [Spirometra erinaceieuropaei]
MLNAFQWIHLNIVESSVLSYWKGSLPGAEYQKTLSIAWLSMIYMLAYIPLIPLATYILERFGLRVTLLLGAMLNSFGAWCKCISLELSQPIGTPGLAAASSFGILMFSQTVCAIAQVFILNVPAHLAAVWFGEKELSIATAIGVFGNQVGVALGFGIPPLIVPRADAAFLQLRTGFRILFYTVAGITTVNTAFILLFFKTSPEIPPTIAQHAKLQKTISISSVITEEDAAVAAYYPDEDAYSLGYPEGKKDTEGGSSYLTSVKELASNASFILLVASYGVNTGVYYAIGTLLSPILLYFFPGEDVAIGWIGFTMVISGLLGAVASGIILEKTKKYRLTVITFYVMSVVSFAGYIGLTYTKSIVAIFFAMFILGFFQSGYLPLGFQYAAEVTYPVGEGLSSGILNTSAQLFGIIIILGAQALINNYGGQSGNLIMLASLIIFVVPTAFLKEDLRRQRAGQRPSEDEASVDNESKNQLKDSPNIKN